MSDISSLYWTQSYYPFLLLLCIAIVLCLTSLYRRRHSRLPPGPFRWPLVDNTFQLPDNVPPLINFAEWIKTYGDIACLKVLGQTFTIINSAQVAHELMDKRGSIYSDRQRMVMTGELMGTDQSFVVMPLGDDWKRQRKQVNPGLTASNIPHFAAIQEKISRRLAMDCLEGSKSISEIVSLRIAGLMYLLVYGYEIKDTNDLIYRNQIEQLHHFGASAIPGAYLVDKIPALKYLPKWMPGTSFLSKAEQWKKLTHNCVESPFDWRMKHEADAADKKLNYSSFLSSALSKNDAISEPVAERDLKWALWTVAGGGMETSMSVIRSFFHAMVRFPDVQAKAQEEISSVVGTDRLPAVTDRENLPYVRGLLSELWRFEPPGPLGVPHELRVDDIYGNMVIPKGTIIPNIWYMLRDPNIWDNANTFNPARFQRGEEGVKLAKYVKDVVFGFGRRSCPGSHFAEVGLFIIIATLLSTCDVLPDYEASKNVNENSPGAVSFPQTLLYPEPFRCKIVPKSKEALNLLEELHLDSE